MMSKVPYTINVNEYICTALENIRGMIKVLDFSGLAATVERIQIHATKMEEALYHYEGIKYRLKNNVNNEKIDDTAFRKIACKILDELEK